MLRGQSFEPEEGDAGVDEARAGRMADAMEKDRENLARRQSLCRF